MNDLPQGIWNDLFQLPGEVRVLTVSQLSVALSSRPILHRISLEVAPGSVLGLIGPNGAGKTTLIRAISGLIPIQAGRVAADGRDLGQLSPSERARILAVVPQARNLPPYFTAWDTVMLGRTPHLNWLGQISPQDEERARQAMQRTDTYALAGRRVGELSGGEQQRLLLARALTQGAPILLLDEPTAHLDLKYQVTLLDLVRDLAHQDGLAVLMALHDLNLVRRCADQVALLVGGELQAMGTPEEVLEPELLSRAYHLPLVAIPMGSHGRSIIVPEERK